jgi:aspartyl-tRNA(Asn)/glutamyl-tRNA(Gln) amidotransferase subunit C
MPLSKKEVEGIAHLSRLSLTGAELEKFAAQLDAILGYVETLNKLDLSGLEPTTHAVSPGNRFREDKTAPGLSEADLKSMVPERKAGAIRVPRILEE